VTLKTASVDGSKLADVPGQAGKDRTKYWGFGFNKMPVNGRVWYPDGAGPFPLVLIVHGNHNMKDFSDPGYAYLGELLASRGFIMASVDENFLNGGISRENDARGWMLLQHLKQWRRFNDSTGSPLQGKVDTSRIALMGHSRGGEAVAVAAAFNRLKNYPDDATVKFDFGFNIRSLVAIAPVDGQYRPSDKPTPVANVNYFLIHGSHDGDVSTFSGLQQYERSSSPTVATGSNRVFRVSREPRPVEHLVGQQGQWTTQRALPRPARVASPGGTAPFRRGDDHGVPRIHAAGEAGIPAAVPGSPRRRWLAAEDDVYDALRGEFFPRGRRLRGRRRRHDGQRPRDQAGRRFARYVEGSAGPVPLPEQHAVPQRGMDRLEQPDCRRRHHEDGPAGGVRDRVR
jgi:dienelactone hydrolase